MDSAASIAICGKNIFWNMHRDQYVWQIYDLRDLQVTDQRAKHVSLAPRQTVGIDNVLDHESGCLERSLIDRRCESRGRIVFVGLILRLVDVAVLDDACPKQNTHR